MRFFIYKKALDAEIMSTDQIFASQINSFVAPHSMKNRSTQNGP
jgi:hypothetical protein